MLQMLVVTLREGIETFLIVAIAIAYLRKTGRDGLVPAAWWGTGAAATLSVVLGVFLAKFAVLPIWEAALAAVAAALVISMVAYMLKHAKKMRGEIGGRIETASRSPRSSSFYSRCSFSFTRFTKRPRRTCCPSTINTGTLPRSPTVPKVSTVPCSRMRWCFCPEFGSPGQYSAAKRERPYRRILEIFQAGRSGSRQRSKLH